MPRSRLPNMKKFSETVGLVPPKDEALKTYLGYVVTGWKELTVRTKQNISALFTDRSSARTSFDQQIKLASITI